MEKVKTISVIISTYNRCRLLEQTLRSILEQNLNGDFEYELIVVDNNSTDSTRTIVESYYDRFSGRLRYLFEAKQGKSYGLNKGIKCAKGEAIAFTDDDVLADKDWLNNIVVVFNSHAIDLLGGKVIPFFNEDPPVWLKDYKHSLLKYPLMLFDLGDQYIENRDNKILPIGANISIRRESYAKFGEFIDSGRSQDIEFCNRWHNLGARIAYSPEVKVYHFSHPSRMTKGYFRRYFFQSGREDHCIYYQEKYRNGRKMFGIPLWLIRHALLKFHAYIYSLIFRQKNNFQKELSFWFTIGIISAASKVNVDFSSLR